MEKDPFISKMAHIIMAPFYKVLLMDKADIFITMDVYIKVKLKITKQMDSVFIMIPFKVINIMVNGKMMFQMERVNKNFKTVPIMKDNFFMGSNQDLGIMFAILAFIRANFLTETFTEMDYSHTSIIDNITDNGRMV